MKNLAILTASIFILFSCSKDDEIADNQFLGEWELIRTTGQFEGSERTGEEMEWQESYTLRANGTFTKKRVRDDETSVAEGTFIVDLEPDSNSGIAHIAMVYGSENNLVANCFSDKLQEDLFFETEELMVGTWEQCDGLGLEYAKKVK